MPSYMWTPFNVDNYKLVVNYSPYFLKIDYHIVKNQPTYGLNLIDIQYKQPIMRQKVNHEIHYSRTE